MEIKQQEQKNQNREPVKEESKISPIVKSKEELAKEEEIKNAKLREEAFAEVDSKFTANAKDANKKTESDDIEFSFEEESQDKKEETEKAKQQAEEKKEEKLSEKSEAKDLEKESLKKADADKSVEKKNLEELASKYNVSVEDAEHIIKQQKHYKDDVNEIAKALLNSQRGYSKLEKEFKSLKEQKETLEAQKLTSRVQQKEFTADDVATVINNRQYHDANGRCLLQEDIVSEYSRMHPRLTEGLDDEKVFELACREIAQLTNKELIENEKKLPELARTKRLELKSSLKDNVPEKYKEEFKNYIDALKDQDIMNPQFSLDSLAVLVKGGHYDEDIKAIEKEAYERGFKEGREKATIVTPPVGGSKGSGAASKKMEVISFTADQKTRMNAMFGTSGMSEELKKISYITYYPEQFNEQIVNWAIKKEKEYGGINE